MGNHLNSLLRVQGRVEGVTAESHTQVGSTLPTSTLAAWDSNSVHSNCKSWEAKNCTQKHLEPKKTSTTPSCWFKNGCPSVIYIFPNIKVTFIAKRHYFHQKISEPKPKCWPLFFCKKKKWQTNSRKQRKLIRLREQTLRSASGVGFFKLVNCVPSGPSASHSGLSPLGTSEVFSSWVAGRKWEKTHTKKVFFHDLLIFFWENFAEEVD